MHIESIVYIASALIFGVMYSFLKPALDWPVLTIIAIIYFGLARLLGRKIAKRFTR